MDANARKSKNGYMHPIILIIFFLFPLAELMVFIKVGGAIGFFSTFLLIFLSAFVGIALIRAEGVRTLFALNQALQTGRAPQGVLSGTFNVTLAGFLFALPGFISDFAALILLLLPLRDRLAQKRAQKTPHPDSTVLEGEFERSED
jgi:UPF0716 protein FxsA